MAKKATTSKTKTTKPKAKATARVVKATNAASNGSAKHLVVVESPAKANTVGRFLGSDYTVKASMGHVRDLPESKLAVDVEDHFKPQYEVMKDKKRIIADLKKSSEGVESVYLATDPDREGEAISWHLLEAAGWKGMPIRRVVFHQITPEAIKEAFEHDRDIDMRLVNAQQTRRILDRLVGYQLSPLLWRKVQRGLSAGRVQSVALRLVVERDHQIRDFQKAEYWTIDAALVPEDGPAFNARLYGMAGEKKLDLPDQEQVNRILADLEKASYGVSNVTKREIKRRPAAPFITSTLQQEAWRQLRFQARKTMSVAQQLYEGIDLGTEGSVGLITYMRTDSPQVAQSAVTETRGYVQQRWGGEYVPSSPRRYTSKSKVAQEAHEAIRPTSIQRDPDSIRAHLSSDQQRLYELIWKRMVASQMSDAVLDSTQVEISAPGSSGSTYVFRVSGSIVKFPGFRTLYMEARDEEPDADSEDNEQERVLPSLQKGQPLDCTGLQPEQHFTQPPPRYTEATLIKALEERGIGRPSTYAPIISTLADRRYVERERGALHSTKLGETVCEQLVNHFPNIMDPDFTAQLEESLDDIANGKQEWVPLLGDFYKPFNEALEQARENMPRVRIEEPTDEVCEKCGKPMVIKHGRFGQFLSCSGFPDCRNSRPIRKKTGAHCPSCGGDLVERRGKGRTFYGCSNYPECNFTVSQKPLPTPCPECEGLMVVAARGEARCTNCAYRVPLAEVEAGVA